MNFVARKKKFVLAVALTMLASLGATPVAVFAHGGEDHDEKKATAVSAGPGMVARVARVGDFEVVIKHPAVEPDKETAARVFVTRFGTNEPIGGAKIIIAMEGGGSSAPIEATVAPSNTPGLYEVKLPPLPKGQYELSARVEIAGGVQTAQYGALEVAPPPPGSAESASSWARTALLGLALLIGIGFAGVVIYRAAQFARRNRIKGEAATA